MNFQETWRKGIKIIDLKKGDLIYIQKIVSGFGYIYECEFISYKKGIVTGKIIFPERESQWGNYNHLIGQIVTARYTRCFLWGKDKEQKNISWAYAHWFKKETV